MTASKPEINMAQGDVKWAQVPINPLFADDLLAIKATSQSEEPPEAAAPFTPAAHPHTSRHTWSTDLTPLSSASFSRSGSSEWRREGGAPACSPVPFRQLSSPLPEAGSHPLELRTCSSLQASECAVSMAETVVCRAAKLQEGVAFLQALHELAETSRLYREHSEDLPDLQDISSSLQLASTAAAADAQGRQAAPPRALPDRTRSSLSGCEATPSPSLHQPGFRGATAGPSSCSEAGSSASVASCGHRTWAAARYSRADSEGYDSCSEGATAGSCRLGLRELRDLCLHDAEGRQIAEEVLQMRGSRSLLSAADERLLEEIQDLLDRYETKRRRHHKKQSPTKKVKQQAPE